MEWDLFLTMDNLKIEIIPVTPIYQNCSLIWNKDNNKGVVVDPGGYVDSIISAIHSHDLAIQAILLTHGHFDHVGGAMTLQERLEKQYNKVIPILGPSKEDQFLLNRVMTDSKHLGFYDSDIRNVQPTRFLHDKERLIFDGICFDVIHVPGHTPGHVVYFEPNARLMITGDTLFKGTIGRSDWDYGNGSLLIKTIKERLLTLGDDVYFIPGHGMGSKIGIEKKTNPLFV